MDPASLALILGGGTSIASLFGSGGDQQQYIDQAIQELIKVKIPDPKQQELALQQYKLAGTLSPELEHAIKQDPSAFQDIVKNQQYSQAQGKALQQLQSLGEEGGLSLSDKADLQTQMIANANKDKANRDAITDDFARRGQLGSGMALQAQLQGSQAAGDRDAQMRLQTLGSARDRALQAIQGAGDLAGHLQDQDYRMQSDAASAKDRINQFNTQNAQGVQQRNVAARNDAAQANLNAKQNLMNSNVDIANKQQQYNRELYQKQFDNQLGLATAKANQYTGAGKASADAAAENRKAMAGAGSGIAQAGLTYADWYKKNNKEKGAV